MTSQQTDARMNEAALDLQKSEAISKSRAEGRAEELDVELEALRMKSDLRYNAWI
jgi:hypothetical protein